MHRVLCIGGSDNGRIYVSNEQEAGDINKERKEGERYAIYKLIQSKENQWSIAVSEDMSYAEGIQELLVTYHSIF